MLAEKLKNALESQSSGLAREECCLLCLRPNSELLAREEMLLLLFTLFADEWELFALIFGELNARAGWSAWEAVSISGICLFIYLFDRLCNLVR